MSGRHAQCRSGKRAYLRADAKTAARLNYPHDHAITAYQCPDCHAWHIGHLPFKVRRRLPRAWFRRGTA